MRIAITRPVSPSLQNCELTHLARQPIDYALAVQQHTRYEEKLAALGCQVQRLPLEADLPDAVFVEDPAIVLDELAIITRPGALSRRPETASVAQALAPYRKLVYIHEPGTLDGGDVLRVGRRLWIGISGRSSLAAIEQVRQALEPLDYCVTGVEVTGCLHLKSAVTQVAPDMLLLNPALVDPAAFGDLDRIEIHPSEPYAANGLLIGDTLIYPMAFPQTRKRLEERGIRVEALDVSELAKAEGAVTCCSLIFSISS
jgi:dimethylargininase